MAASIKPTVKWHTDMDKSCLISNFEKRGWKKGSETDWNFYWSGISNFRAVFNPTGYRLSETQIINHFPNNFELTRKDTLVKNIKRYQEKSSRIGMHSYTDFLPLTFTLPGDYNLFAEEFKKAPNSVWIMKPTDKARGIGIFIVNRLAQIKKWSKERMKPYTYGNVKDPYVVSAYIDNPLLIGSKKFDLRLYVLVTSWKPLLAYKHTLGFCRFCTVKYTQDVEDLDNNFMHLTNVSIQKTGDDYNETNGGKWNFHNLILYLNASRGRIATEKLLREIDSIFVHSLRAVENLMSNDRHCFECYGYDIIIDADLRPWLIEVNASPSLSATTTSDRAMKHQLINDIIDVVCPLDFGEMGAKGVRGGVSDKPTSLGGFIQLLDE